MVVQNANADVVTLKVTKSEGAGRSKEEKARALLCFSSTPQLSEGMIITTRHRESLTKF
jgi:hypothetical protein